MKTYTVRDMYLAASLMTMGLNLIEITQKEGDWRKQFIFEDAPERREFIQEYWSGQGNVPPKKLIDNLRGLKDRMFAERLS